MRDTGFVAEILPDHPAAEAAVHDLVEAGLADRSFEDRVRTAGQHVVDFDIDAVFARSVARGVLVGIPLGALASAGLVMLAAAIAGVGLTDGMLGGLGGGAVLGVLFGGVAGVARSNRATEAADAASGLAVEGDEVVVMLRANGRESATREVLERHGARPVDLHLDVAV
jgi:hypothetical protein